MYSASTLLATLVDQHVAFKFFNFNCNWISNSVFSRSRVLANCFDGTFEYQFDFSFVFAALQTYFKHTVWQSVVLINITAVLLIAIHAMFYLQKIDWNAVSESQQQLSLLQQVIHSDIALWIAYILPFLVVMLIAAIQKYRYSLTKN